MLSKETLIKLAIKFQTSEENIAREYVQNIFLSILYQIEGASKLLFKGGTALKLVYKSPRYSEDLDFTGMGISVKQIENLLEATFVEMERLDFKVSLAEATPTSGGYLGKIYAEFYDYRILIKLEISLREKGKIEPDTAFIENEYIPNYLVYLLPQKIMVGEKVNCLLGRGKPRDYFDIYFILRNNMLRASEKKRLKMILDKLDKLNIDFRQELGKYLPKSLHPIIKGFAPTLKREINRYVP